MRVYFTFDPRPDLKESLLRDFPEVDFVFHKKIDAEELAKAEVIVTYGEDLDEEKHIGRKGDNLDEDEEITICTIPAANIVGCAHHRGLSMRMQCFPD